MKKGYIRFGLLLIAVLAFFGGTEEAMAVHDACKDNKDIKMEKNTCKWYGAGVTAYTAKVPGGKDRVCIYNIYDGDNDSFEYLGDGKKTDVGNKYSYSGCPVIMEKETDGWNETQFHWYKSNGEYNIKANDKKKGDGWWQFFSVEDDYYNAENKSSQLGKKGMNIQINELNAKIEPTMKKLYQLLNGVDNNGNPTYYININGAKTAIHPYDVPNNFGYADVISQNWKMKPVKTGDFFDVIRYLDYHDYFGQNDANEMKNLIKNLPSNKLIDLSNWGKDAVEAFGIFPDVYNKVHPITNEFNGLLSDLKNWGNENLAILGATETLYSKMAQDLVTAANNGGELYDGVDRRVSRNHTEQFNMITNSINNYAKYIQFTLTFESNNENTTLIAQWVENLENDINNRNYQLSLIESMCKNGYDIAKEKNNSVAMNNFSACSNNANNVGKNLKELSSSYRETAKSLKADGFNWRDDVVANCENMLSSDLINILKDIYFFIEVLVVAAAVILSMIDFFKAVSSSDADALKKTWSNIIKRIIIVFIVILLPLLVEFIAKATGNVSDDEDDPICLDLYGGDI